MALVNHKREFDDGIGELEDATCAMDWVQDQPESNALSSWFFVWCLDCDAVNDEKENYEFYFSIASG